MKKSEEKICLNGTVGGIALDIVGKHNIKLKMAKVYDWFDQAFWVDGLGDFSNGMLNYSISNSFEKGLYIVLCVSLKDEVILGRENDNSRIIGAFCVGGGLDKNPIELYKFIVETRDRKFNEPEGNYQAQGTESYNVFVFAKNIYAQTVAQYCDVEIYPYDYLTMESETNYINRFFKHFPGIDIIVHKEKFEREIPAAVFCVNNIYASSYDEAQEYALRQVEMLNSIYTILLRSHGEFFAALVFNTKEKRTRISMLDTRYKGNLLLLAEQGFNIKHFYKHISTSNSYLHVYLKLLNEAMNETNPMLQYYRFWNIAEGIASKKQYHSRKMKKWDGSSVIGKGKDVLIGETALNNVFELYRENFGSISDKDFAAGLEKISKPKEFLSVCYQRRNCCAHLGTCFSADGKICDKNDKVKKLCKESFIVNKEEALGFQDKILRKLQDTVFRIVLNELITESGEVKKETDLVDCLIKENP